MQNDTTEDDALLVSMSVDYYEGLPYVDEDTGEASLAQPQPAAERPKTIYSDGGNHVSEALGS